MDFVTIEIPYCCTPLANVYRAGNLITLLDLGLIIYPGNITKINKITREKMNKK